MVARIARPFTTTLRGVFTAVGLRWRLFTVVAVSVFLLDILVPPLVLSLARKPVDFFTFNPWLKRLPDYFAAPQPALTESSRGSGTLPSSGSPPMEPSVWNGASRSP
jgi:hypothetical protein